MFDILCIDLEFYKNNMKGYKIGLGNGEINLK